IILAMIIGSEPPVNPNGFVNSPRTHQPSALWHSASLLSELKLLSDLSDKNVSAGYMNASSVCWPLKANQSILASSGGRLQSRTTPPRSSARLMAAYMGQESSLAACTSAHCSAVKELRQPSCLGLLLFSPKSSLFGS